MLQVWNCEVLIYFYNHQAHLSSVSLKLDAFLPYGQFLPSGQLFA